MSFFVPQPLHLDKRSPQTHAWPPLISPPRRPDRRRNQHAPPGIPPLEADGQIVEAFPDVCFDERAKDERGMHEKQKNPQQR